MHASDGTGAESRWRWLAQRDNPPARAGELGTIADCEPGDLVVAESPDGKRFAWALIAFRVKAGFDERAAFAYVAGAYGVRLRIETWRCLPSTMRVRFVGVRPAFAVNRR